MLLLPQGLAQKKTLDLTVEEMAWLANGEDLLRKLGLTLACQRCLASGMKTGAVLRGANSPSDAVLTITCGCRQLRYRVKQGN